MRTHVEDSLSVKRRKEIFLALVQAQDRKVPVRESRKNVAESFGVDVEVVEEIEEEGIDGQWPPLA